MHRLFLRDIYTTHMEQLLTIAMHAAREAGKEILELYTTTDFETKHDGSPVTIADIRSNEILVEYLSKTNIPILSEESTGAPIPYPNRMWIIDPLDGTKDFIQKNGDFAVMIGLIEHGRPVLGVVYAPTYDTLYYAQKGAGAFVQKKDLLKQLKVSDRLKDNLRCIRSINHFSSRMEAIAEKLNADTIPRGSFGIKAGVLSEGDGDYFASFGNFGEWDVCAPEIITIEAGGSVSDCNGEPIFYGTKDHHVAHGIVFSNTACHENILNAIKETADR